MILDFYFLFWIRNLRKPNILREVLPLRQHKVHHALVPELPHVDLQREQREHHQAENGQCHDFSQLFERMQ